LFFFLLPVYCVLNVSSFSGLSIFFLPLWCSLQLSLWNYIYDTSVSNQYTK
jgi:hypothetical protein